MTKNISAIVVTYNPDVAIIASVLKSISEQVNKLILIDNNSDNLNDFLIGLDIDNIILIKEKSNIGLALAQNKGILIAKEQNSTHVLIFDQDSLIEKNFVRGLTDTEDKLLSSGQKVAAIGPVFYDSDAQKCYPATLYIGPFISTKSDFEILATSYIISSGSLIRMSIIDKVGLMKSEFFIDYIDVEWCFRAHSKGYKVFMTRASKMQHTIGDRRINIMGRTISIHSPLRRYYLLRNSIIMLRMPHISFSYKLREVCLNFFRITLGFIYASEKQKYLYFTLLGLRDGLCGRGGKFSKFSKR